MLISNYTEWKVKRKRFSTRLWKVYTVCQRHRRANLRRERHQLFSSRRGGFLANPLRFTRPTVRRKSSLFPNPNLILYPYPTVLWYVIYLPKRIHLHQSSGVPSPERMTVEREVHHRGRIKRFLFAINNAYDKHWKIIIPQP